MESADTLCAAEVGAVDGESPVAAKAGLKNQEDDGSLILAPVQETVLNH